jgi:hypothetical protein
MYIGRPKVIFPEINTKNVKRIDIFIRLHVMTNHERVLKVFTASWEVHFTLFAHIIGT